MFETVLKLYSMAMATGVRSPLPHLFGPPGCGKSSIVADVARVAKVNLHTINVSRISPLEVEGVQMPVPHLKKELKLKLLTATFWTQLNPGDILLLDEFLRGFPEVYNGLLDILTSRNVGGYQLPPVFIIAASNSTTTYDPALADRLLHIPVPDLRSSKAALRNAKQRMIDELGLAQDMLDSYELAELFDNEVLPTYELLDMYLSGSDSKKLRGSSPRHLIGSAQLRMVNNVNLKNMLRFNNSLCIKASKLQHLFLFDAPSIRALSDRDIKALINLKEKAWYKLTPIQQQNLTINLDLISIYKKDSDRNPKETNEHLDDASSDDLFQ